MRTPQDRFISAWIRGDRQKRIRLLALLIIKNIDKIVMMHIEDQIQQFYREHPNFMGYTDGKIEREDKTDGKSSGDA